VEEKSVSFLLLVSIFCAVELKGWIQKDYFDTCRIEPRCSEVSNYVAFPSSGRDEENIRMEILELDDHPYFVATQYHPEYLSRPLKPSPPFFGLILASVGKLHSYLARGCRLTPRQLSDVESGNHKKVDS
jgi:hypothetical protein